MAARTLNDDQRRPQFMGEVIHGPSPGTLKKFECGDVPEDDRHACGITLVIMITGCTDAHI